MKINHPYYCREKSKKDLDPQILTITNTITITHTNTITSISYI